MDDRVDVVVVGGGLAGLGAALYLARAGRSVAVLEKAEGPGGRARSRVEDGFTHNLGPHALYGAGAGTRALRELGIPFSGRIPNKRLRGVRGGRVHVLPAGPGSLAASRLLPLRAKREVALWFQRLRTLDPREHAGLTVDDWLAREMSHPLAREYARAVARVSTYSDASGRQSAEALLNQFRAAGKGVLYLDGGWQTLVDGMARALAEAGVSVYARTAAAVVQESGDGFRVAARDGRTWRAASVALALPPGAAATLAPPSARPTLTAWAARAEPVRAAVLDLALEKLPRSDRLVALAVDRPLYLSVHSAVARLAPAGRALVHLAWYLGPSAPREPRALERALEELMDAVQPGWRSVLRRRRFVPDLVVANALVTAEQGGLAGRPGPEVPGTPGLFVVGDWVGPEGLLADASLASARQAARSILAGRREAPAA